MCARIDMNELTPQPNHSSNELSEEQITNLLASSTVPSNLSICLRGFESQEQAKEVGRAVGSFLHLFGTVLNLERLDGVTVAYDYDAALATVETGTASPNQLAATNDSFARGVAMAIRVLREGEVKCHIVAAAGLMSSLRDPNDPAHSLAVGLLAHEAAHVHDLLIQDRAFPGVLLRRSTGYREGVLLQIAQASWDEYAACRLSAEFEHKDQLTWFEDTFCSFAEAARARANEHIRQYRRHSDLTRLVPQVVTEYGGS
jgi:hypothetical protein